MEATYDPRVDALYLRLAATAEPAVADTVEVRPGVMLDLDAEGRLVGIEVLDASSTLTRGVDLSRLPRPEGPADAAATRSDTVPGDE